MHAYNTLPHPTSRGKNLLRALALASLVIAGLVLPFVWDLLAVINDLPKMGWLQNLLALSPALSWLMMFVWGAGIPLALLLCLYQSPHHKLRNGVLVAVLMLVTVTWYVHMPISGQCLNTYPNAGWACLALQWGYSLSLGIATAAYVFTMFAMALSALGLMADNILDGSTEPG